MKTFYFHKISENPPICVEISRAVEDDNPKSPNLKLQLDDEGCQLAKILKLALPVETLRRLVAELA